MNDQVDMSRFIEAKSDQLNADDLIGTTRVLTVTRVTGNDGDQPVSIFYEGDNGKPFKPCKTIRRVLMGVWGRYAQDYVGKSMRVYRDDKVTFGGLEVGGIRISHMSHIDKEMVVVVMKSKGKKAGMKILPLKQEQGQRQQKPANRAADWNEGPDQSQQGENFSHDANPAVWQACADSIQAMIDAAIGKESHDAAGAELDKHEKALPQEVVARLDAAWQRKRTELMAKAAGGSQ